MRKVVVFMHISLDGFADTTDESLEWTFRGMSEDVMECANQLLSDADTILFGRRTYEGMRGYWSTVPANPESTQGDIDHAHWMEQISKIVFSTTLESADWTNSSLVKEHIAEEINTLKQQPGQSMMTMGTPRLVHSLMAAGLIDEYRLFVHPIALGGGVPLFKDLKEKMEFKLSESRVFSSGVVYLRYESA